MTLNFGILCFPNVQQLDLTGPYEVFASAPNTKVELVWKNLDPIRSATGLMLQPDVSFAEAADYDVICIPGGDGVNALLTDTETLNFVKAKAARARFITSVCTGSLVLGQADLLKGKRATSHWGARDFLSHFGAIPTEGRVVRDGNVITAGGVTSGIDFGLTILAELFGDAVAQSVQLSLEYAPAPPFNAGLPETAPTQIVAQARSRIAAAREKRKALLSSL